MTKEKKLIYAITIHVYLIYWLVTVLFHEVDVDVHINVKPNEDTIVKEYIKGSATKFTLGFSRNELLTYFQPCSTSIPPENIGKPEVFWCFQGGIEMEHWLKMG